MADFPRQADLFRIARDEILSRNPKISKDAVERPGTDANILVYAAVACGDELMAQLANVAAGIYLDSAQGAQLDRYAYDRYQITRKPASVAQGSVVFSTNVPAAAAFTIPAGTMLQTPDGIQFLTIGNQLFPQGATSLIVPARSVLAGSNQQVGIGTITSILSPIPNQPAVLTVTNTLATAGADDEETDSSLRDRCRRFYTTARRGTLDAIVSGALGTPGVNKASAFEMLDAQGRPTRYVMLVVADAYTDALAQLNTIPPTYQTQSQQLTAAVFANLDEYRVAGTFVQVIVASVVLQPIQLSLTFQAGFDPNIVTNMAKAAVVNYINTLKPGDDLVINAAPGTLTGVPGRDLQSAIAAVPGLAITGGEVQSPQGTIVVKPLQVLRTALALVSAVSTQTQFPLAIGTSPDLYVRA